MLLQCVAAAITAALPVRPLRAQAPASPNLVPWYQKTDVLAWPVLQLPQLTELRQLESVAATRPALPATPGFTRYPVLFFGTAEWKAVVDSMAASYGAPLFRDVAQARAGFSAARDASARDALAHGYAYADFVYATLHFIRTSYVVFHDLPPVSASLPAALRRTPVPGTDPGPPITERQEQVAYAQLEAVFRQWSNTGARSLLEPQESTAGELLQILAGLTLAQYEAGVRTKNPELLRDARFAARAGLERLFGVDAHLIRFTDGGISLRDPNAPQAAVATAVADDPRDPAPWYLATDWARWPSMSGLLGRIVADTAATRAGSAPSGLPRGAVAAVPFPDVQARIIRTPLRARTETQGAEPDRWRDYVIGYRTTATRIGRDPSSLASALAYFITTSYAMQHDFDARSLVLRTAVPAAPASFRAKGLWSTGARDTLMRVVAQQLEPAVQRNAEAAALTARQRESLVEELILISSLNMETYADAQRDGSLALRERVQSAVRQALYAVLGLPPRRALTLKAGGVQVSGDTTPLTFRVAALGAPAAVAGVQRRSPEAAPRATGTSGTRGGTSADDLGRKVLKAFAANDIAAYEALVAPNGREGIARYFQQVQTELREAGLGDWSQVSFGRVTYSITPQGTLSLFDIEFDYGRSYRGRIGGSNYAVVDNGRFFLGHPFYHATIVPK